MAFAFLAPRRFEQGVVRMALLAGAGGLLTGMLHAAGMSSLPDWALPMALATAGIGSRPQLSLAATLGLFAGALLGFRWQVDGQALATLDVVRPLLTGLVAGAGIGAARHLQSGEDERTPLRDIGRTALAAAPLLVLGLFTATAIEQRTGLFSGTLAGAPGEAVRALLVGLFVALSSTVLHLRTGVDAVTARWEEMEPQTTGDLRELATQVHLLHGRCVDALETVPSLPAAQAVRTVMGQLALRSLEAVERWQRLDRDLAPLTRDSPEARLEAVRKLMTRTQDAAAQRALQQAERAVEEERTQRERIGRGRERVVARLHADVAVLERTRLSLLSFRSAEAGLVTIELGRLKEELESVSAELERESSQVERQLKGQPAPLPMGTATSASAAAPSAVVPVGLEAGDSAQDVLAALDGSSPGRSGERERS